MALCCWGEDCLSSVRTYLPGTVLQWCRLFKQCPIPPAAHCVTVVQAVKHSQNLPAVHCVAVVQTVYAVLEPTCRALCYRGAGCLSGVRTYLLGTVLQWCRLFKQCQNLPAGHCVTVVQTVKAMSEPTCWALCYRGAGCLSSVRTYLLGTRLQW